jgi:hypothetical protein
LDEVSRLRREGRRRSTAGKREPKYMAKEQTFPTKQTDTGGYPWVPEWHILLRISLRQSTAPTSRLFAVGGFSNTFVTECIEARMDRIYQFS